MTEIDKKFKEIEERIKKLEDNEFFPKDIKNKELKINEDGTVSGSSYTSTNGESKKTVGEVQIATTPRPPIEEPVKPEDKDAKTKSEREQK